jgi:MerR family transcriptional regulator, light-induced transcriptional regulator
MSSNSCPTMDTPLFSVQSVARRAGLSAHTIRAWEKRYRAVRPARSRAGQRRYTEADVQRLVLLGRATNAGHAIGTIAHLPDSQLRRLLNGSGERGTKSMGAALDEEFRRECIAAVEAMNEPALIGALEKALVRFGQQGLLRRIVAPLAEQIGELWRHGELTAAHEHFFTATARTFIGTLAQQFAISADAPVLVAATPAGQYHELGAFMAAVSATYLGWRGVYLGCSLPAAEIAAAVIQVEAPVLVLSIIYPCDDRNLPNELRAIRKRLPDTILIVGGRVARSYGAVLKPINARVVDDIAQFGDELDKIRAGGRK